LGKDNVLGQEFGTKYVDPGPCLTWQNHGDHQKWTVST